MDQVKKSVQSVEVVFDFPRRPEHMSRTEYMQYQVAQLRELCEDNEHVSLRGYFYRSDIAYLYDLLGYELPEELRTLRDIPTQEGRFFYTMLFNNKVSSAN